MIETEQQQDIRTELFTKAELILDEVRTIDAGAQAEVFAGHSSDLKVVFENTDFSVTSDSTTTIFGLRLIASGRLGFVTTNATTPEALRGAAREAFELARLAPPSEHHMLAEVGPDNGRHFELIDPALFDLDINAATEWTDVVIRRAKTDPRVAIDRAEFGRSFGTGAILNTNGVRLSRSKTIADWYAMGMARDGEDVTSFDYDGGSVGRADEIADKIDRSMRRFADSVLSSLGGGAAESYEGPVLLHPRATADLLGGAIVANCNGRLHQDGISPWKDLFGELVGAPGLWLTEEPRDETRAAAYRPFDREGIATASHDLVREGRLAHIGHNCFSAHRGGTTATGNATGSARSLPGIGFGPISIGVSGDSLSDDELHRQFGNGLILKRFSGNRDSSSGQFSGVAKNGHLCENGARGRPVKEVMIAGNLFDALKNIRAASATLHELGGSSRAPYMIVDGLSVTAG